MFFRKIAFCVFPLPRWGESHNCNGDAFTFWFGALRNNLISDLVLAEFYEWRQQNGKSRLNRAGSFRCIILKWNEGWRAIWSIFMNLIKICMLTISYIWVLNSMGEVYIASQNEANKFHRGEWIRHVYQLCRHELCVRWNRGQCRTVY